MALADKGSRSSTAAAAPPAAVAPSATAAPNRFCSALEKPNSNSPTGEPNVVSKTQAPVKPAPEQQLKPQTEAKNSSGNNRHEHRNFKDELSLIILIWRS